MTEIFPIDNTRALTWNGRRACTAQSLTAIAHLDITLMSPILSQCVTNKKQLVKMLLPIHEQVWKNPLRRAIVSELGRVTVEQVQTPPD